MRVKLQHGILFDMDGTLIESESIWQRTEVEIGEELGVRWTLEDSLQYVGTSMHVWAEAMIARGAKLSPMELGELVSRRVADEVRANVPWIPGAQQLLQDIANAGIPAAIVTNAAPWNAQAVLDAAPEGALRFAVSAYELDNAKPHPEPYLVGAEKLGIAIDGSIAMEDSEAGASAVRAAGLGLWFVETHSPAPAASERSFADLTEVTVDDLLRRLGQTS